MFGGNFHTHNSLHLPPGVDAVCFSNGADYVRGLRHAVRQARAGRIVMSVDSTALLNERHLLDGDDAWQGSYPDAGEIDFGHVGVWPADIEGPAIAIVTSRGNEEVSPLNNQL